jgi:hypothetical protein
MVEIEWMLPLARFRACSLSSSVGKCCADNLRPSGAFRGKGRQLVGKVVEWYVRSRHLQDCSPRLCRLRTDGLTPVSKYWTYQSHAGDIGLVNLVVGHRQELGLRPLLYWLALERSWVWTRGSVSRRIVDYVGSPFSQEQWDLPKSVSVSRKVTTYGDRQQEAYVGRTWTDMWSIRVVLVGFSPAGCTSIRIATTLGYE